MRRIAHEEADDGFGFNPELASMIDQGYATTQLLAIRKLTDPSGDALSLPRLLSDMKRNSELFTRELYVCNDGLSFEGENSELSGIVLGGSENPADPVFSRMRVGGPTDAFTSQRTHKSFDMIPHLPGASRRDELVNPNVFDALKSKLGVCANVSKVASKFVAHAADAQSRKKLSERDRRVTFEKIRVCQRAIVRVASAIRGPLLDFSSTDLYPTPQYDHLEKIEVPMVRTENVELISDFWDEHQRKNENWLEGGWDALVTYMS